jgi:hypothetical protein
MSLDPRSSRNLTEQAHCVWFPPKRSGEVADKTRQGKIQQGEQVYKQDRDQAGKAAQVDHKPQTNSHLAKKEGANRAAKESARTRRAQAKQRTPQQSRAILHSPSRLRTPPRPTLNPTFHHALDLDFGNVEEPYLPVHYCVFAKKQTCRYILQLQYIIYLDVDRNYSSSDKTLCLLFLTTQNQRERGHRARRAARRSVYLLYWYKSTNTAQADRRSQLPLPIY